MIATRSLLHPNEPLPPYSPRQRPQTDLETDSVRSQAPSYVSEVPSYHSDPTNSQPGTAASNQSVNMTRPPTDNSTNSIVSIAHRNSSAMGDQSPVRHSGLPNTSFLSNDPQKGPRSSSTLPPNSQPLQYSTHPTAQNNVPNPPHRTTRVPSLIPPDHPAPRHEEINSPSTATAPTTVPAFLRRPSFPAALQAPRRQSLASTPATTSATTTSSSPPISPLEDPLLVGPEAAAQARSRRLYIANCNAENRRAFTEAETELMRKQEAKSWDFLLAQIGDWEGRERNWKGIRGERTRDNGSRR